METERHKYLPNPWWLTELDSAKVVWESTGMLCAQDRKGEKVKTYAMSVL